MTYLGKKVGIVCCGGDESPLGIISRKATLMVLRRLRRGTTTTVCLPLFSTGDEDYRLFARFYPTIAVDGCGKLCAKNVTSAMSAKVVTSISVEDLLGRLGLDPSSAASDTLAQKVAEEVSLAVDSILAERGEIEPEPEADDEEEISYEKCACGIDLPVQTLVVGGKPMEVRALPLIFEESYKENEGLGQIMSLVAAYNPIPEGMERDVEESVSEAYKRFLKKMIKKNRTTK